MQQLRNTSAGIGFHPGVEAVDNTYVIMDLTSFYQLLGIFSRVLGFMLFLGVFQGDHPTFVDALLARESRSIAERTREQRAPAR